MKLFISKYLKYFEIFENIAEYLRTVWIERQKTDNIVNNNTNTNWGYNRKKSSLLKKNYNCTYNCWTTPKTKHHQWPNVRHKTIINNSKYNNSNNANHILFRWLGRITGCSLAQSLMSRKSWVCSRWIAISE